MQSSAVFSILIAWLQLYAVEVSAVLVPPITVHAEFAAVNYTWDETHTYEDYVKDKRYIVENNVITGIKVDKMKNIFITVPRWLPGVPGTLNKLVKDSVSGAHVLQPFPSWDMQEEGVYGDLQNCQSMLIDSQGVMWALEVGRRNFFLPESQHVDGAAGVWHINVNTGEVLDTFYFPEEVLSYNNSFLNDIVLDEARDVAYFSDAGGPGAIIVYDRKQGLSRRYSGISTANDPNYVVYVNGNYYGGKINTPTDGIAISSDGDYIYYCAIQGNLLYRLPTSVLRDFASSNVLIDQSVSIIGKKQPSDGIVMWDDVLYFGSLPEATYYALDLTTDKANNASNAVAVWPDPVNMRWVSHIAIAFHSVLFLKYTKIYELLM